MAAETFQFGSPLASRMERLVNNQYLSDVAFAVGKAGEVMVAHKLILTMASEVFHAQFNGNFADSKKEKPLELPDIEPPIFVEILRYMYCDEVNLSDDNVVDVYYGAQKYLLKGLETVCEQFLADCIDATNALKVFDANRQHEFPKINDLCLDLVRDDPLTSFEQRTFLNIQERSLELIIQSPTINCTEAQLRSAIQKWIDANDPSDQGKLLPDPSTRAMQCRRLSFYGNFGYTTGMKTEVKFTLGQSANLYGVGIFIGASNWKVDSDAVNVTVDIETSTMARREVESFPAEADLRVCELVFGKVKIPASTPCTLTVTMKSQGLNIFYLDCMKPVDCLNELNFTLSSYSINGTITSSRFSHIAYLLYNINKPQET